MNTLTSEEKQAFSPLLQAIQEGVIPERFLDILIHFFKEYKNAAKNSLSKKDVLFLFQTLTEKIAEQLKNPHLFSLYHQKIEKPFDYHQFGLSFVKPLIDQENSHIQGKNHLLEIENAIKAGENVVLLANHQSELDPQIIESMIEPITPSLGKDMIFVAGERVITDPTAIPFSLGRNLLCIYSKKYIDYPPEKKAEKQSHNQKTMRKMKELLDEGGKAIYVAPSGGRDRKDKNGEIQVAPFDPNSIELFYLMARKAKEKTHFYPLALYTYELLPPPADIQKEIGEERHANFTPIFLSFGEEVDMEAFSRFDKQERKKIRANEIHKKVAQLYSSLGV